MTALDPIVILLVEDDPGDVVLVREAFEHNKVHNELRVASDGVYALEQLRDPELSLPDLILLDLNLPRKDGREVLAEIRADARLTAIPVVVLTTSNDEADVLRTYDLGVNSFITKPVTYAGLVKVMRTWTQYWFQTVDLPIGIPGDH